MKNLANVDVFQDFPLEALARLAAGGIVCHFPVGATLMRQGEVSGRMYVITRGCVRKELMHPSLSEPLTVLEFGPGESVGELGVLDMTPWPETVRAIEETDVIELSALGLAETMLLYPGPSVGLLSNLSRFIRTLADLELHAYRLRLDSAPSHS